MNPHEILQIGPGATPEEVRAAYHRLAKEWHPDRFEGAEKLAAEAKFREIAQAYSAIKKGAAGKPPPAKAPTETSDTPSNILAAKKPEDWLSDAKNALADKQFGKAVSMSQYCFNFPKVAEEARITYAKTIEATVADVKVQARAYEDVINVNPNNKEAILKLADLYVALNMPIRAESMLERARALGVDAKPWKAPAKPGGKVHAREGRGLVGRIAGLLKVGGDRGK